MKFFSLRGITSHRTRIRWSNYLPWRTVLIQSESGQSPTSSKEIRCTREASMKPRQELTCSKIPRYCLAFYPRWTVFSLMILWLPWVAERALRSILPLRAQEWMPSLTPMFLTRASRSKTITINTFKWTCRRWIIPNIIKWDSRLETWIKDLNNSSRWAMLPFTERR